MRMSSGPSERAALAVSLDVALGRSKGEIPQGLSNCRSIDHVYQPIGETIRLSANGALPRIHREILTSVAARAVPGSKHADPLHEAAFFMHRLYGDHVGIAGLGKGVGFVHCDAGRRRLRRDLRMLYGTGIGRGRPRDGSPTFSLQ